MIANRICSRALTDNVAAPYLKLPVDASAVQSVTRGLVGDTTFAVLPNITPRMSFILTLAAQIVSSVVICYLPCVVKT
jgi:alpha-1,3-glucosyltransferase